MWRKLRYGIRFFSVYLRRYSILLLAGTILGGIGFWSYPWIINHLPKIRPTQTIGLIGRYEIHNLPSSVLKQVGLGLTQIDEQGQIYPGLAKNWQVSDQGKTWVFELDNRLTWGDGQPITAQQLKFNFQDVQVEAIDDTHIKFQLPDPFSPFPSAVTTPLLRDNFIGVGPYKFTKFKHQGKYLKAVYLSPVNKSSLLPQLHYLFYGTEEAAKIAFKLGEVDTILELLNVEDFTSWPQLTVNKIEQTTRYVGLFFNLKNPDFKEKNVRQALAYALEDKTHGQARVLSPITASSWAYNLHVKPYDYDLERAKKLWGDNHQATNSAVELSTVSSLLPIAETIAADWDKFGLPTEVRVINSIPPDFQVLLITQEVPADPDQYVLWHSTQPTNLTGYQNPKVDKLLEDGRKELNADKRLEIYQEFQKTLLEDLPVIFLFRPVTYTISRN